MRIMVTKKEYKIIQKSLITIAILTILGTIIFLFFLVKDGIK